MTPDCTGGDRSIVSTSARTIELGMHGCDSAGLAILSSFNIQTIGFLVLVWGYEVKAESSR